MDADAHPFETPKGQRFLKEWFGGVYHHWEKYGDTTLPPYLADQFNANFGMPAGHRYAITYSYQKVVMEGTTFTMEYIPHTEAGKRTVRVTLHPGA